MFAFNYFDFAYREVYPFIHVAVVVVVAAAADGNVCANICDGTLVCTVG